MRNALLDVLIHAAALLSLMAVMHVDLAARVYAVYYAMLTPSMLVICPMLWSWNLRESVRGICGT